MWLCDSPCRGFIHNEVRVFVLILLQSRLHIFWPLCFFIEGYRERLLVLGSGWGSYNLLQRIDQSMYQITVVSPRNRTPFSYFYFPLFSSYLWEEQICVWQCISAFVAEPVRISHPHLRTQTSCSRLSSLQRRPAHSISVRLLNPFARPSTVTFIFTWVTAKNSTSRRKKYDSPCFRFSLAQLTCF